MASSSLELIIASIDEIDTLKIQQTQLAKQKIDVDERLSKLEKDLNPIFEYCTKRQREKQTTDTRKPKKTRWDEKPSVPVFKPRKPKKTRWDEKPSVPVFKPRKQLKTTTVPVPTVFYISETDEMVQHWSEVSIFYCIVELLTKKDALNIDTVVTHMKKNKLSNKNVDKFQIIQFCNKYRQTKKPKTHSFQFRILPTDDYMFFN
jgi:hypothetical protein